jgi:2-polyprenyl-3-methyl-5-hydroxy-6-metoxy-1,4-benzoquinol methylase
VYKSEKFWDRIAKNFDKPIKPEKQKVSKLAEQSKKFLKKADVVLDYGCATGTISIDILDFVKEVQGIDISSKMIEVAERKAVERKIENIKFTQSNIFDERYKCESFNIILGFNILHLLEDENKILQKIHKLLKPEGLFISATPCLAEQKLLLGTIISIGSKLRLVPKIKLYKISDLERIITEGNFQIVETKEISPSPTNYFVVAKKQ